MNRAYLKCFSDYLKKLLGEGQFLDKSKIALQTGELFLMEESITFIWQRNI